MASASQVNMDVDNDSAVCSGEKAANGSSTEGKDPLESPCTTENDSVGPEMLATIEVRLKRHMKKDDSGISVEKSEVSSDDDANKKQKTAEALVKDDKSSSGSFPKLNSKAKNRNYRKKGNTDGDVSSDEESTNKESGRSSCSNPQTEEEEKEAHEKKNPDSQKQESAATSDNADIEMEEGLSSPFADADQNSSHDSDADSDSDTNSEERKSDIKSSDNEAAEISAVVLMKGKPKHKWFVMQEVINRQKGSRGNMAGPELFQRRCYGSLHAVQRLELMSRLEGHNGCVNTLHFNSSGSRLASGSDDLKIIIWDWALGKKVLQYDSGHRSNVFQAKFLPLTGDMHIVSCARDGQVRLAELSSTGLCRATRRLAQHRGPAHKLALQPDSPHVFLSAGEDAIVNSLDVRESKPQKLVAVKEGAKKIALYSIHANPLTCNEFCVSGRDHFIRIYDKRKICEGDSPLKKYCPHHLLHSNTYAHVTCAVFNYNGTQVLGSYNDEDIYLFGTNESESEYLHRYEGHRNNATVKGINFFGPKSEFVVSGSDCGNIFFWDKEMESVVQFMPGDENGVVNCLEPHPQMPVLATSGLDDDVKIWVPSCEQEPAMPGLKNAVILNHKDRDDDRQRDPDAYDGQMLWILWRHIRRTERRLNQQRGNWMSNDCGPGGRGSNRSGEGGGSSTAGVPTDEASTDDDSDSDDQEESPRRVQCSPS
ncbi:DDB1- and CUL4-associated factor 8-like [Ischnura elegans]|uniref:DDB1- and CUL4-associated factor 8-like n=1 Tax=Ischnura elegans TaxID=197161 RepID=UPI001ED8A4B5|nr:DDB1- and CUL4-associated factor 8-like [Ischnura elegans]XP_046389046.1 DDB1- and CUL4-associated factor 8-like [Ischnura elegans]XP_046389047.1 DDB1- and CUL4-associated factor 8-like [Ischnura elegans]